MIIPITPEREHLSNTLKLFNDYAAKEIAKDITLRIDPNKFAKIFCDNVNKNGLDLKIHESIKKEEDCFDYMARKYGFDERMQFVKSFLRSGHYNGVKSEGVAGDLAIYTFKLEDTIFKAILKHIGVYDGEKIISKWGTSSVYEHPPELVPVEFGEEISFITYSKI